VKQAIKDHPAFVANPIGDWQEVVGEEAARACRPVSLRKGILVILAEAPVWKHHLEMHKTVLQDFINSKTTEPIVRRIVIRIGELPEMAPILNPDQQKIDKIRARPLKPPKPRKAKPRPLTAEEKLFLKTIPDPDLRALGTRLLKYTYLPEEP
jgi:hypothetical protein